MVAYNFNAAEFDPAQGVEIWPDNLWVKVIAEKHDPKPIKDKEGEGRLLWTLRCVEQPQGCPVQMVGKVQYLGMNLWINNDRGAADIAKRELSALTYVTLGANAGRINFADFSELHNIPFYILSKHGYNSNTKAASQDWGGFKDIHGRDPKDVGGAPAAAAAPTFGAPAAAPGGFPGAAPAAAPAPFAAPQAAPAAAPFAAPAAAPAPFGAPAAAPAGFPPAAAPAPAFAAPPAMAAAPVFAAPPAAAPAFAPGPGQVPGGFAPPANPAGSPPWPTR